jgi:hypothetical protein
LPAPELQADNCNKNTPHIYLPKETQTQYKEHKKNKKKNKKKERKKERKKKKKERKKEKIKTKFWSFILLHFTITKQRKRK